MSSSASNQHDRLLTWLAADARLESNELIVGAVVVFRTERLLADGVVVHRHGRAYPFGEISPTEEVGLIEQARRAAMGGS